jgi:hypothetical protein
MGRFPKVIWYFLHKQGKIFLMRASTRITKPAVGKDLGNRAALLPHLAPRQRYAAPDHQI